MSRVRFWIPNTITAAALACGVIAIVHAMTGEPREATWWILYATLLDRMDGGVARALKATSPLGGQLDSFSDVVAFGVAPAFVYLGMTGADTVELWLLVPMLIYVIAGTIRLARFHLRGPADTYLGMPTTLAGGIFAVITNVAMKYGVTPVDRIEVFGLLLVLLAVLMNLPQLRYARIGRERSRWQTWAASTAVLICAVLILTRWLPELLLLLTGASLIAGPFAVAAAEAAEPSEEPPAPDPA